MARKKFAKKLDFTDTGGDHPVFRKLKDDKRTFHHQPETNMVNGPTKNSEYYWYPDLEREALAYGWTPRGNMKNQVPWTRKDLASMATVATPGRRFQ